MRRNGGKAGQHQGINLGFSNETLLVEAHKQRETVLRQSKGELAACMGHPKSHAAAFRFFASLEAAAIGLWNIK
jgi:hypothetical protein